MTNSKKIFSFILFVILFVFSGALIAIADEKSDTTSTSTPRKIRKSDKRRISEDHCTHWDFHGPSNFGGAGGFTVGWLFYDTDKFKDLNVKVKNTVGQSLSGNGIWQMGGGGYGYIHPWRIGGFGMGGERSISNFVDGYSREVKIDVGFGGFSLEYVFISKRKFDVALGGMVGGGGINIALSQSKMVPNWNGLWANYQGPGPGNNDNIKSDITGAFFAWEPYLSLKFYFANWVGLKINGGYLGAKSLSSTFRLNGDTKIAGAPTIDMSGPIIQVGPYFGWR